MKKLLLVCCLFFGLATASFAQTAPAPPSDPQQRAKGLQKELKLSDDQTSKVGAIYQDSAQKFDAIKKKDNGDTNKMLVDIAPLRKATIAKIKALLTASQAQKYNTLINSNKDSGLQGGWSGGWS